MTLGGFIAIRNGFLLDYCWEIAAQSLLDCCDRIVICDSDSTDGTRQRIDEWAAKEPRITVTNFPWTDPKGDIWWWPNFLNAARQHLTTDWAIYLDADEILHADSYEEVRVAARDGKALKCHRFNFWRDERSLIPHGKCCGHEVIRVGPQRLWMPSDYPDPRAAEIQAMAQPSGVKIMHYGFLREKQAFFRKARTVLGIWANSYDERLERAEKFEGVWSTMPGVTGWENDLVPFTGTHPKLILPWLEARGYGKKVDG